VDADAAVQDFVLRKIDAGIGVVQSPDVFQQAGVQALHATEVDNTQASVFAEQVITGVGIGMDDPLDEGAMVEERRSATRDRDQPATRTLCATDQTGR
jgi:hypothetical protein